jgi:uncharacterized damage-inducible protein DinB
MTKRLFFASLAGPVVILAQASTPVPANPISTGQSKMYVMLSGMVVAAADKMPETNYAFKPSADVRGFGQLVGHVADSQYYFCSSAAGETPPAGGIEKSKTTKTDLVAALKESVAYCTKVYGAMTDAKGSELTKMMNMDFARMNVLAANIAHDYEHYGNMATYMRIKGIIPPSSDKSSNGEGPK